MKLLLQILIIFFTLAVVSKAENIKGIKIIGNERISDETVKVYGAIDDEKKNFSKQDLDKVLKNIYETNFFKNVSVEIKDQFLVINLEEYPLINQLVLVGEKANRIKDLIIKNIKSKEKSSFIQNNLRDDINIIKYLYSTIGYNFA